MSDRFSWDQKLIIDRDNRNMADADFGFPMGAELNAIWAAIDGGAIGITANPYDVDAVARAGGVFSHNEGSTSGLTWAHRGGQILWGQTVVTYAAGTVTLTASAVNYVEADSAGVVSAHTSPAAFSADKVPLYKITCGSSSISLKENYRVLLVGNHAGVVVGTMLSTAGKTKTLSWNLGTWTLTSAADFIDIITPNFVGVLSKGSIVVTTDVAPDDSNYCTFDLMNKGQAGAGTTAMLAATAINTTKITGGINSGLGLDANVVAALTLHGTPANLVTAAQDVLRLTATPTGTGPILVKLVLKLDVTHEV